MPNTAGLYEKNWQADNAKRKDRLANLISQSANGHIDGLRDVLLAVEHVVDVGLLLKKRNDLIVPTLVVSLAI